MQLTLLQLNPRTPNAKPRTANFSRPFRNLYFFTKFFFKV